MKRHFYFIILIVTFLSVVCTAIDAASPKKKNVQLINGVYYELVEYNHTAYVTFDDTQTSHPNYSGLIILPEQVTYKKKTYVVRGIGYKAFEGCEGLTGIWIPKSVDRIGVNPFKYCSNLKSIKVEEGNEYYDSRDGSKCIIETKKNEVIVGCQSSSIPQSVTAIGSGAFAGCKNLTSIDIPQSVDEIKFEAFRDCEKLENVTIRNPNAKISSEVFSGTPWSKNPIIYNGTSAHKIINKDIKEITLKEGTTSIGNYCFSGCKNLTSITLPNTITEIGAGAFDDCVNLTSVNIPQSVTAIGDRAFADCKSLTSIIIPQSVTKIDGYTFYNCKNLTSIDIPQSVTTIGYDCFWGCEKLSYVHLSNPSTFIRRNAFNKTPWWDNYDRDKNSFDNILYIGNVAYQAVSKDITECKFKEGTTAIGDHCFEDCENLTAISIPESITRIGWNAFYKCSALRNVNIPDQIKTIDANAFARCENLEEIKIPESVITIGIQAFYGCASLTETYIPESVTTIDRNAFSACKNLKEITVNSKKQALQIC